MNNLEFDHADIFRDLADVQRTFLHLARIVPRNGWIVLNGDDDNLRALGAFPWTRTVRVGTGEGNDVRITDFAESPAGAEFALSWRGRKWADVKWSQPGLFNARNAAMAATAAQLSVLPPDSDPEFVIHYITNFREGASIRLEALARFRGVKRRQELLVDTPQLKVIEDFGHHPTALAETLHSLRARHPGLTVNAVFEPRSNTARTKVLQAGFTRALGLADEVYIGAVNRADKLKEGERFSTSTCRGSTPTPPTPTPRCWKNSPPTPGRRKDPSSWCSSPTAPSTESSGSSWRRPRRPDHCACLATLNSAGFSPLGRASRS
jgi:UDP-N-acetylmuramate: L-alanyl-gamma-D-glutamyl-meso-diaminopimelate ligase